MTLAQHGHIHILGIAGHAMAGVALAAQGLGYTVTGTDENAYPPMSEWLTEQGITWWREPSAEHLTAVDVVVVGGGVAPDHVELVAAQAAGLTISSYPELVGQLLRTTNRIVVTGTHGKTTTTSLIAWLLESAGRQPDYLVGIKPKNFTTSVRLRGADVAVLEGDEYRSSRVDLSSKFSHYQPSTAIITAIEMDHPDLFKDLASVRERFDGLVAGLPAGGRLLYCADDPLIAEVASGSAAPAESYDGAGADWRAEAVTYTAEGSSFTLMHGGETIGSFTVPLYGAHNVSNATAALAAVLYQGLTVEELQAGLAGFKGASRRFERVSRAGADITVIDDYAHHPTEVAATLAAAKQHFSGRVIAVFQPHTYSRTQALLTEYQQCFSDADEAYVVDIEGAREQGVASDITAAALATEPQVQYAASRDELLTKLQTSVQAGDVVVCMTVNGYDDIAGELARLLNS